MRQHITPQQQKELSKKEMKRYDVWYREHYAPYAEDDVYIYEDEKGITQYQFPPLSIGQMIEFLDEHGPKTVEVETSERNLIGAENFFIVWDGEELCDALWRACKQVLEKP